ncbi:1,4-alpha-glucan branching protein GlgB [Peribacillus cavernae]|uniref:1,4-alpha-glucan branching enzyme GlgB n=1 Tax=Peribacillus cavernae TaxID=1674310 RepID=A0A3S0VR77_9BACI|nr:1,4-alpha-glucan branching protein GlgB [Peribacillus cavernae]MDQ0218876.1 1,4-alpha-glucan branching enzyme [Peribacillus cavernae]RUQ31075.1 1,4-alpha-glucan branching protein GlgB [Peribacillus cavernae]
MGSTLQLKHDVNPSEFDLYLFHEGTLYESYKTFGAHPATLEGIDGIRFAVWAPNARKVSLVGDFNNWDGNGHTMDRVHQSGVWVIFVSGLQEGELYKYEILTQENKVVLKADPYAFFSEERPNTASIVHRLDHYEWHDQKWIASLPKSDPYHRPMLIYEVHLGSWKKKSNGESYSYRELADELIEHVLANGFTHIEIMPLMEHPFDGSWGYQITGYFSATSRFGTPEDFMHFVDCCHQRGIGVIMDWVPAHFCKDEHGLGRFDGTPLYEPIDPLRAERPLWGTYSFDFTKPEVVSFLISNALFWMDVYHIDGFRVDAVSSMVYLNHDNPLPQKLTNEFGGEENGAAIAFIKKLNETIFEKHPGALMMAEEATEWPLVTAPTDTGGLGFNYKWNMGWVNDVLRYMKLESSERANHHNLLTFSFFYAFSENFVLPFSHDDVVHGKRSLLNKMSGDYWQKFANYRLLYGYFMTHPGKKLLFMGSELGQFAEWKDKEELDWNLLDFPSHQKLHHYLKELNQFYQENSSLWRLDHEPDGFEWIDHSHQESVLTFMRKGKRKGDYCIVVCNFSANVYERYRIGIPSNGKFIEVFNSDAQSYGGSGIINQGAIGSEKEPYHNQRYSMEVTVPPLGVAIFMKQTKNRRGRVEHNGK